MTSLCKWLAADAGIVPELGTRILDLGDELAARPVDAVIHTAPVPQALATMAFGGLLPGIELAQQLSGIHYKPTIAVMVAPAVAPTGLADHGGSQHNDDPNHPDLAFVADNQAKGISPVPAVTIHSVECHQRRTVVESGRGRAGAGLDRSGHPSRPGGRSERSARCADPAVALRRPSRVLA